MADLTPLAVAALGLLDERQMHPYEMFQLMVQRAEDRLVKVKPGSLYHTVDRLARERLVTAIGTEREGNRPERTLYEITDAGRLALTDRVADLLGAPINEYPVFPLAMAEAHNLPSGTVRALLTRRLALLEADITAYENNIEAARTRGVPRQYWIDAEYSLAMLRAEHHWITGFLAELAAGTLEWSTS